MINFIFESNTITLLVGVLLFLLLFFVFFVFISRFVTLYRWTHSELEALDSMIVSMSDSINGNSFLYQCNVSERNIKKKYEACYLKAERISTKGLTFLSIAATISPFIGLFGTVVGILDAFSTFSNGVSLSTIAPAISEALIATAMGILVAIPAYASNLILKRKAYEVCSIIKSEIELAGVKNSDIDV